MKKPTRAKPAKTADPTETPPAPTLKTSNFWRETVSIAAILIVAVAVAYFTKLFIVQPYIVDGVSMETTLQNGDRLLVNKLPETFAHLSGHRYVPKRGDIIIFNQSNLPGYTGSKQLVKRVVGLPGERVVVKNGYITVYDAAYSKGFDPDTSGLYTVASPMTLGNVDITLNNHQIFVCGDNRANSEDSRYFGPVDISQIVGKLSFRIFPLGKIHHY